MGIIPITGSDAPGDSLPKGLGSLGRNQRRETINKIFDPYVQNCSEISGCCLRSDNYTWIFLTVVCGMFVADVIVEKELSAFNKRNGVTDDRFC